MKEQESYFSDVTLSTSNKTKIEKGIMPFSPALAWSNKKGNVHEIELANLEWKKDVSDYSIEKSGGFTVYLDATTTYKNLYALKYKFTKRIFKNKTWKIKPMIAYGTLLRVNYIANRTPIASELNDDMTSIDAIFQLEPNFQYDLSDKFNVQFSLPIPFWSLQLKNTTLYDQSIPEYAQSNTNFSLFFFPNFYQVKLALAYKI